MDNIKIMLEAGVLMPKYESSEAVGFDLRVNKILRMFKGDTEAEQDKLERVQQSFLERGYIKLRDSERVLFGTGVHVDLPNNIELQIRPKSGVSLKQGLMISNSPGTIDPDFTGEIGVIVYNSTPHLVEVKLNQKLCQAVPKEVIRPQLELIGVIDKITERGENGYGSTGID
jgi:dUTP pyrophosphatase